MTTLTREQRCYICQRPTNCSHIHILVIIIISVVGYVFLFSLCECLLEFISSYVGGLVSSSSSLPCVCKTPETHLQNISKNFIKFNFRSCFNNFTILQGIFHRIGDTFMRLKKWSEAERFHRAALEAEPNHIPSHISYGTMLARNVSWKVEKESLLYIFFFLHSSKRDRNVLH